MKVNLRIVLFFICALMAGGLALANGIDYTDSQGYFGVPNDNVGIGTSKPAGKLDVEGTLSVATFGGDVGIGTWVPAFPLVVNGGAAAFGFGEPVIADFQDNGASGTVHIVINNTSGPGNLSDQLDFIGNGARQWSIGNDLNNNGTNNFYIQNSGTTTQFFMDSNGNLGLGTTKPAGGLTVMSGNVGIGTWVPGTMLDVNGTARMTGFTLTGEGAGSGYVIVGNSVGVGTWMPATTLPGAGSGSSGWTATGNNVYETAGGNVGIGTNLLTTAALTVMNGNVGIGTWVPRAELDVEGTLSVVEFGGNVGIGSLTPGAALDVNGVVRSTIPGNSYFLGNLGVGSTNPGTALDVTGISRMTGFTLTGNGAGTGYVLVGNSVGIGTWMSATTLPGAGGGGSSGWTATGNNVYETAGGNVGIGTTLLTTAALTVMNGNVGIGTWVPGFALDIEGNNSAMFAGTVNANGISMGGNNGLYFNGNPDNGTITFNALGEAELDVNFIGGGYSIILPPSGNVGIGSSNPAQMLDVNGTARMTGFILNHNPGAGYVIVGNGVGVGTWMPAGTLPISGGGSSGWTATGSNVYETADGNVGIGTNFLTTAALTVMNGNVGIGTWAPNGGLMVMNGNVGIGSIFPTQKLAVAGGAILENQDATAVGTVLIGDPPLGGYPGIWLGSNAAAPSYSNYSFLSDGTGGNLFNAATGQLTRFRINNMATLTAGGSGIRIFGADTGAPADAPLFPFQIQGATNSFVVNSSGNVGVGTTTPASFMSVAGGVGIGTGLNSSYITTAAPAGGLIVQSNVGIGSLHPGQALDVNGTARMTGFTLTGEGAANGYVMVGNSVGVGTWMPASTLPGSGGSGGWTATGNNVYETAGGNVGIGTTFLTTAALTVMSGNVGIGTWVPDASLEVNGSFEAGDTTNQMLGSNSTVLGGQYNIVNGDDSLAVGEGNNAYNDVNIVLGFESSGYGNTSMAMGAYANAYGDYSVALGDYVNVGIAYGQGNGYGNYSMGIGLGASSTTPPAVTGTSSLGIFMGNNQNGVTIAGNEIMAIMGGNVGIGSTNPSKALDVQGTVRMAGLILTGNGAANGYVMVGNSVGVGTWMPASTLPITGGSGTNYWLNDTGNVGISTIYNIGVGTISQKNSLNILGNVGIGTFSYDPYMKTAAPDGGMIVSGNVGIGTWVFYGQGALVVMNGNVGIGSDSPNAALIVGPYMPTQVTSVGAGIETSTTSTANYAALGVQGVFNPSANTGNISHGLYFQGQANSANNFTNAGVGVTGVTGQIWNNGSGTITGATDLYAMQSVNDGGGTISNLYGLYIDDVTAGTANYGIASGVSSGSNKWNIYANGTAINYFAGNVGIGSSNPGTALDVNGTARMTGFTLPTGATNNFVLTSNASGVGTWQAAGAATNYWFKDTGNVGIGTIYNIGIGTISQVNSINVLGNVGIGTFSYDPYMKNAAPNGGMIIAGNVGIGTWVPGGALTVMGGNVGIGTWKPITDMEVVNPAYLSDEVLINNGVSGTPPAFTNSYLPTLVVQDSETTASRPLWFGYNTGANAWAAYFTMGACGAFTSMCFDMGNGGSNFTAFRENGTTLEIGGALASGSADGNFTNVALVSTGNVGISTESPGSTLSVSGGASFGSYATLTSPAGGLIISGNVGVGSSNPGTALDVNGTVRMTGFTLPTGATNNFVLTSNASGVGTWQTVGAASNYWFKDTGNVGIGTIYNIGIGTISQVNSLNILGNVGIGTFSYDPYMKDAAPNGGMIVSGNVGIGTWVPGTVLQVNNTMSFQSEYNNGNSGAALTINWNKGNKQKVTMNNNCTFTFTPPASGVTNLLLKLVQDGTGGRTASWPAAVKWPSGSIPALTVTPSQEDVVTCYYDGGDYLCTAALNYTP